jgi:hypothetical protein
MGYRQELEKKIEKKLTEITEMEHMIYESKAFVDGLREALKMCPPEDGQLLPATLRAGSDMDKVRENLRLVGQPMHIDKIVATMGKPYSDSAKAGLAGSLSSYAKKRKVFTKTAPKTFGLIEFDAPKLGNATLDALAGGG